MNFTTLLECEPFCLQPYEPTQPYEPDTLKTLVYYESIKRELNKRLMFECLCDARLKAKAEGSTRLAYTK